MQHVWIARSAYSSADGPGSTGGKAEVFTDWHLAVAQADEWITASDLEWDLRILPGARVYTCVDDDYEEEIVVEQVPVNGTEAAIPLPRTDPGIPRDRPRNLDSVDDRVQWVRANTRRRKP